MAARPGLVAVVARAAAPADGAVQPLVVVRRVVEVPVPDEAAAEPVVRRVVDLRGPELDAAVTRRAGPEQRGALVVPVAAPQVRGTVPLAAPAPSAPRGRGMGPGVQGVPPRAGRPVAVGHEEPTRGRVTGRVRRPVQARRDPRAVPIGLAVPTVRGLAVPTATAVAGVALARLATPVRTGPSGSRSRRCRPRSRVTSSTATYVASSGHCLVTTPPPWHATW